MKLVSKELLSTSLCAISRLVFFSNLHYFWETFFPVDLVP